MNNWEEWKSNRPVSAIVLAAGLSSRMGQPKMVLPWGETTVIRKVVSVLESTFVSEIIVVTGGGCKQVESALADSSARMILNPYHANMSMVTSLQIGIKALSEKSVATLVVLGDQPQVEVQTVRNLLRKFWQTEAEIIVPSYENRRGHPWLVSRKLWPSIINLDIQQTLRSFLDETKDQITYLPVTSDSILKDLDTYEEWLKENPNFPIQK
jgi:molybdenum cofactor cytidylyltransferase